MLLFLLVSAPFCTLGQAQHWKGVSGGNPVMYHVPAPSSHKWNSRLYPFIV